MAAQFHRIPLEESKIEVGLADIDALIEGIDDYTDLFYVKWGDAELACDRLNGWAFADYLEPDDTDNPFSRWKAITREFGSLEEALDFPILGGRSVRERFGECRFFFE